MNTLDSVVDALARDPGRKFVVAEQVTRSPKFPTEFSFFSFFTLLCHLARNAWFDISSHSLPNENTSHI
jgi:hypothetical protein